MDEFRDAWPFLIPIVAILGSFAVAIAGIVAKARVRELEIRERIAMIEKGLVPPPEVDPRGFDRAMRRYDRVQSGSSSSRFRSAGVVLFGVGLGLMVLIGFSGAPSEGIAVGGFICVLALAFLLNSVFEARYQSPSANGQAPAASSPSATGSTEAPVRHD